MLDHAFNKLQVTGVGSSRVIAVWLHLVFAPANPTSGGKAAVLVHAALRTNQHERERAGQGYEQPCSVFDRTRQEARLTARFIMLNMIWLFISDSVSL